MALNSQSSGIGRNGPSVPCSEGPPSGSILSGLGSKLAFVTTQPNSTRNSRGMTLPNTLGRSTSQLSSQSPGSLSQSKLLLTRICLVPTR